MTEVRRLLHYTRPYWAALTLAIVLMSLVGASQALMVRLIPPLFDRVLAPSSLEGSVTVTVASNGSTSNPGNFTIGTPTGPAITSLEPPAIAPGGSAFTLIVNGSSFAPASIVRFNGSPLKTRFVSREMMEGTEI